MEPISHNVRYFRKLRGMTQAELAREAGTTQYTVSEIELAHREPHPATLRKLALALGLRVADFYGEADSPLAEAPPSAEQPPLNGFIAEERRKDEELAVASMTALAEEGERLEEDLKEVVEGIPTGGFLHFFAAHNLARLLYEEWSLNRQVSAEMSDVKERLDAVGERMDRLIRQLIHPGSAGAAKERDRFANARALRNQQEAEGQAERGRKDATA